MKFSRPLLLAVSCAVVVFLVGAGLAVRVGAGEPSYRQAVLFSEVLAMVLENYVDPVETESLLGGAYEGMLAGIDANSAYLDADEVAEWKRREVDAAGVTGLSVLKAGNALQIVAVDPDSPAAEAGVKVGDHLREIDGRPVGELSLGQARMLLSGKPGSRIAVELLHVEDDLRRERVELLRATAKGRAYEVRVQDGVAVLRLRDVTRLDLDTLREELDDVRSRGVGELLVDLRNLADDRPEAAAGVAGLFAAGTLLQLRDRAGDVVRRIDSPGTGDAWGGSVWVLVNAATAGSGEALAGLLRAKRSAGLLGESTYGLGAEPKLYELDGGAGLLISAAVWETDDGLKWNGDGFEPDATIRGEGDDVEAREADRLQRALGHITSERTAERAEAAA